MPNIRGLHHTNWLIVAHEPPVLDIATAIQHLDIKE